MRTSPSKSNSPALEALPPAEFKLHEPFAAAGDQPQAIRALTRGFQAGRRAQVLLGATGTGKTFTMAHVIANLGRPALVLSHNKTLAAQLYSEFREFFPENAVHYFVSYYDYYQPEAYIPQRDVYIEKDAGLTAEPLEAGAGYRVTGISELYDGTWQIKPRFQSDLAELLPPVLMLDMEARNSV